MQNVRQRQYKKKIIFINFFDMFIDIINNCDIIYKPIVNRKIPNRRRKVKKGKKERIKL